MITVGQLKEGLAGLDGKTFDTLEDLQNAVFPLFPKISKYMQSSSHWELVDMLIYKKWATTKSDGKLLVKFPSEKPQSSELEPSQENPYKILLYDLVASEFPGKYDYSELLKLGLVEKTYKLTEKGNAILNSPSSKLDAWK